MLKARIATAALLLPFVIFGILYLPRGYFLTLSSLVFLLAGWEWGRLAGFSSLKERVGYVGALALLMGGVFFYLASPHLHHFYSSFVFPIALTVIIFWILMLGMVSLYPRGKRWLSQPWVGGIVGGYLLIPCWLAVNLLQISPGYLLYLMALVWTADTGAYFAGRQWGKTKLCASVSPGKSWEGALGGVALSLILAVLIYRWNMGGVRYLKPWLWLALNGVTVAFSIVGDLGESLFKRIRGVKDSGHWLPGHGGILDRIDSLTAAAPLFLLQLVYFSYLAMSRPLN